VTPTDRYVVSEVIIAGAGPVGLTLAHELGSRDVHCVLVEPRLHADLASPRCKQINPKSMEAYRGLGVAQAIRDNAGLPFGWSDSAVFCTSLTGHTVERFDGVFALSDVQRDDLAEPALWCAQNRLEETLRNTLTDRRTVSTWWGCSLVGVEQDETGVTAVVAGGDGEQRRVRGAYLVGADGSRSRVRGELGIRLAGRSHQVRNVQVIFTAPGLAEAHPRGRAVQYWVLNSEVNGLMGMLDTEGTWWAIIIDAPADLDEQSARDAIHTMIGENHPIQVRSMDPWQARMLVADRYRHGRCFLAGDAAHQNPPWGGFGANTGIGDAVDLGWKMAAALHGWAGPALLESYEHERRPVALRAIAEAERNMRVLTGELARPELVDEGEAGRRSRQRGAETIRETKTAEMYTLGFVLGTDYRNSPLIASEDPAPLDPAPCGASVSASTYRPSGAPGSRLPHRWLNRQQSLYDVLGPGFTLLEIAAPPVCEWEQEAAKRNIPVERYRLNRPDWHSHFGARYVLVRPDRHVAWRGDETPLDVGAVLDKACGGSRATYPLRDTRFSSGTTQR
jgi:2-polyprenyl-6-methoxyphenol hydroxylase-like FAD-dependent oxidoreductase